VNLKIRLAAIASALALAGGLTLTFAGPASASALILCSSSGVCLVNHGAGADVTTTSQYGGTAWAYVSAGVTWDGRSMDYVETGDGLCLTDDEAGYLYVNPCAGELTPDWVYFWVAPSGAIVSESATGEAGHFECVWADVSNDLVGNSACPSGTPAPEETWTLIPVS